MGPSNPASHPELLDELSAAFRDSGFDLKLLMSAIVASEAYRRTSEMHDAGETDPERLALAERYLARRLARPLTGEQLYDSLALAIGLPAESVLASSFVFFGPPDPRTKFLEMHRGAEEMPIGERVSAAQALALMNGSLAADATSLTDGPLLASLGTPGFSASDKVEAIFLSVLSRRPADAERELLGEAETDEALADLVWATINSAEFAMNH